MNTAEYIREHLRDDVRVLALGTHPDGVDVRTALVQIAGWQAAVSKLPDWAETDGIVWPEHIPMEQCTSQHVAAYKSGIVDTLLEKGFCMADLTGGLGVDCYYLSKNAGKVYYNDLNRSLSDLARNNFRVLGRKNVSVSSVDADTFLKEYADEHFGLIYIDPARRSSSGKKLVSLKDCLPDVTLLQHRMLDMADVVMVKMSPMLDISVAIRELVSVSEIWVLSLAGECKELLAVMKSGYTGSTLISAVNIASDGTPGEVLRSTVEKDASLPLPVISYDSVCKGNFLYDPYASYMKSGLYRTICDRYGVSQLHPNSHLFISDTYSAGFPGRHFEILKVCRFDRHSAKDLFQEYSSANVTVRNFPMTADEIRTRFRFRDGGGHTVFATVVHPSDKVLIVAKRI